MKTDLIIFDIDGTLLNTADGIIQSVNYTISKLRLNKLPYESILNFVGPPIQDSFKKYYNFNESQAQHAADIFRTYYKEKAILKALPYYGIYEVLNFIKSKTVKIAIATYKREDYAIKIVEYFGMDKYCSVIHGADNFNELTKADIITKCVVELNSKKPLYIGDTILDYNAATEAGCDFIGVSYGFGFKPNENYDFKCANNCKELLRIIE